MMLQPLPPGVQDHEPTDSRPEACGIGRDLEQRGRGRAEEQVIHDALVHERQAREDRRHRKDHVDVPDGQEFLRARRDPGVASGREALGAMPVTAAVVREGRLRALITAIAMPTQRRRTALNERPQDTPMLAGEPGSMRPPETDRRVGARGRPPQRVAASPRR